MSLLTNLVSYYKLDESSGNAADSIGSNILTNSGVTYSAGKINNGAVFNGSSSILNSGSNIGISGGAARTISLWVNQTLSTGYQTLASWGALSTNGWWQFELVNGFPSLSVYGADIGISNSLSAGWHHLCLVYTGGAISNSTLFMYVDGVSKSFSSYTGNPNTTNSTLRIGSDGLGVNYFYNGSIDEVGIWSRALSSTEITTLNNSGNGLSYPFGSLNSGFLAFF